MTHGTAGNAKVTVVGEALIDLVPIHDGSTFGAHPGGSPFNVAVGLARLGVDTSLMARLSDHTFGRMLRDRATAEGIDLRAAPHAREAATLAVVSFADDARVSYDFYIEGTADWQWSTSEMALLPKDTAIFHFGSLASWIRPGADRITELAEQLRHRDQVLVSYDPNIRPSVLRDHSYALEQVERCVRLAHIVKASREDNAWLYPDSTAEEVIQRWMDLGSMLVIVTEGAAGAAAFSSSGLTVSRPGIRVPVVDTVGAGDAFTAGLIASLLERGVSSPRRLASCDRADLVGVVDDAIVVSAMACQRAGADPPRSAEIEGLRSGARQRAASLAGTIDWRQAP